MARTLTGGPTNRVSPRTVAILDALVATALFGTIGTARVLGPEASSWTVGAVRLVLAASILAAIAARISGGARLMSTLRLRATWVAGIGQAAFQVTFLAAVELTGVAVGTLLAIGTAPAWSGLLARHVTRGWAVATGLAVVGLALLVGSTGAEFSPSGAALAIGAGLAYAVYTAGSAAAARRGVPPATATAGAFAVAAGVLLPALAIGDLGWLPTREGIALVAYLALVPTVVAYLLFARALRTLPAPTVQTLGLTEPVVATVLGVAVLGERLTLLGGVGVATVLAGLVVLGRLTLQGPQNPAADTKQSAP